jgi:ferredoxin
MAQTLAYHHVRIEETGESFACREAETALNALARSGRKGIPLGCRGGGCGVCKVEVVEGHFSKRPMSRCHVSEAEEACNHVLACCIVPESDLQLRVVGKMQRALTRAQ